MTAAISATGITRAYDSHRVIDGVSLKIEPGEIVALVGPNGSGKTTLMLMLATLLAPDEGEISIAGISATRDPRKARAMFGWMPDSLGSWDNLTVTETLTSVCLMYGMGRQEATARAGELLEQVGLAPLASNRTNTLSRGQKQKLSLARALAHHPRVLLLDEPAAGLDPEARRALRKTLRGLASEGVAILITSHVMDELDQLATRVLFLRAGRLESEPAVSAAINATAEWRVRALDNDALVAALIGFGITPESDAGVSGASQLVALAGAESAAELLRNLVSAGVAVVEFAPAHSTLEQAFIRMADQPGSEVSA